MSYETLSENIVAALVIAAGGDLSVGIQQAVNRLEAWQKEHNCHFGTERADVSSSLRLLCFADPEFVEICGSSRLWPRGLTLLDVLPRLLTYKHWYANDEGSYWEPPSSRRLPPGRRVVQAVSFRTLRLRQHLTADAAKSPDEVLRRLTSLGFSESQLRTVARRGESS